MAVTQVGIVYYTDDPHQRVFRRVYPEFDDSELDGPVTGGLRQPILDPNGVAYTWTNYGTDPLRAATHQKIARTDTTPRLRGTPFTAATEPVIYWVNADTALAGLTPTQATQLQTWLAANPQWSNNFVDLGTGNVAALTAGLVAPCWIVIAGGGTPSIGTLQRSTTVKNVSFALWVV